MTGVIFVFAIVFAFLGFAVGKGKGYGALGAVLGFAFSLLGVLIVAVMPPSAHALAEREGRHAGR